MMRTLAFSFLGLGVLFLLIGGALWVAWRFNLPLGRLPGDIHVQGKGWSVAFPIVTCILLSLLLTIILNLFWRR